MTVRVRFAPSPTGYLHIGGARTALYNFLFARHEKGTFILRVEDTDQQRNTEEALQTILAGLRWLGLSWDEGPYYQSKRLDLYREWAARLEKEGRAYWKEDPGKGRALYFKIPRDRIWTWKDQVLGEIKIDPRTDQAYERDLVLLKSDGFPNFIFCNMVDDADMRVTHVVRGADHVANTAKQLMLYDAFGIAPPAFGHIPLIYDPQGKKISKREKYDFPVTIDQTQEMGYLPEAFVNFIALLGWSPGGNLEIMTLDEMCRHFTLDRVGATPARFLRDKLDWMNGQYIRKLSLDRLVEVCRPRLLANFDLFGVPEEKIREALRQRQERLKRLDEIRDLTRFFFQPTVTYDEKAVAKWLKNPQAKAVLTQLRSALEQISFEKEPIETLLKSTAEKFGVKMAQIAQPLRVALTGVDTSPPIHETLALLGKERSLKRIDDALKLCS